MTKKTKASRMSLFLTISILIIFKIAIPDNFLKISKIDTVPYWIWGIFLFLLFYTIQDKINGLKKEKEDKKKEKEEKNKKEEENLKDRKEKNKSINAEIIEKENILAILKELSKFDCRKFKNLDEVNSWAYQVASALKRNEEYHILFMKNFEIIQQPVSSQTATPVLNYMDGIVKMAILDLPDILNKLKNQISDK